MKSFKLLLIALGILISSSLFAQSGMISGTVTDGVTGDPLPGANVYLEGMTIGTITSTDGMYRLQNVPEGPHTVSIKFVGYVTYSMEITLEPGGKFILDATLEADAYGLAEVVVTAQMLGQAKAINQQLNSDALVNVVSSDKIKELPDVNAAEAIGRLPGISVNRNGGEASKVVIRGLSPSLTSVTINGVRVPSSSQTDRSVDLSMISPDLLSNIEVYKSPTADMDGDAIGGIVNLGVSKANDKPQATIRTYGGYNNLSSEFGNYKGSIDLSRRFFDKKLGVIARANYEKVNRSSENLNVTYDSQTDTGRFRVDNMTIIDEINILKRTGGSLQLDYQYGSGYIMTQGFYSQRAADLQSQSNKINNIDLTVAHSPRHSQSKSQTFQGMITGKQSFSWMDIDWLLAQSNTLNDNYYDVKLEISEAAGVTPGPAYSPEELLAKRAFNYQSAWIHRYYFEPEVSDQVNRTASLDFKLNYHLGSEIGGFLKFGGKYRTEDRSRDVNYQLQNWYYLQAQARDAAAALWPYTMIRGGTTGDMIMIDNFYTASSNLDIWGGEYYISPNIDMGLLDQWQKYQKSTLAPQNDFEHLDYVSNETVSAGYVMTKLNVGNWLTLIPGVRYEGSDNSYQGTISSLDKNGNGGSKRDTTVYINYGEVLPSVHAKIKPLPWFDIRFSAVKTLARPNYSMITPWAYIDVTNGVVERGNPDLKYAVAWNYDGMLSFFSNKFGLFTIGGFYKQFDNYFVKTQRTMSLIEAKSLGYPASLYNVKEDYVNFNNSRVYGFEMDLQTNLKYLPKPFNGVVMNFNSTRLWSETFAPLFQKTTKFDPVQRRNVVDFEKSYWEYLQTALPDQVTWIFNASIGYDYKTFSARISMVYQSRYLKGFSSAGEGESVKLNNKYVDNFLRFDASISQKIGKHIMIMANLANFTSESEREYQYQPKYPVSENRYGSTFDVGLQYKF